MGSSMTPLEALNIVVSDTIVDLRLVGCRTLANLYERGAVKTFNRTVYKWDVNVGGSAASWESLLSDGANTATDVMVPAQLNMSTFRLKHQFSISRVALVEASTMAPDELKDLFQAHIKAGLTRILREMNRTLWVGDGEIWGFNKVSENVPYAGINPATFPRWGAVVLDSGTSRPLTRDLLLDLEEQFIQRESYYNFVAVNPATAKQYIKVFDQIAGGASVTKQVDGDQQPAIDLGHGSLFYNGLPIIQDPMVPAGQFSVLNTDEIELLTMDISTKQDDPDNDTKIVSSKTMGLNVHLAKLPSQNSAVHRFELFIVPGLVIRNRNAIGTIKNLT